MSQLILASTSRYRRALLKRLGLPFQCQAPLVDEEAIQSRWSGTPTELVTHLAREKARSIHAPNGTVIGSDQMVVLANQVLGKPLSAAVAVSQLETLSGKTHELLTAFAVLQNGRIHEHLDVTRLTMRSLNVDEIMRYVAVDEPTDCAGSYKLESRGITLFESIESRDHTAIVGLPLIALTSILRNIGFPVP